MSEIWQRIKAFFTGLTPGDLEPRPLDGLRWDPDSAEQSLERVFEHVRSDAAAASRWYLVAKRPKRRLAILTRNAALLLTGLAGLLPLLAQLSASATWPGFAGLRAALDLDNALWVSALLALAAGLVAFDRHLGYSTGWVRYVKTELQLRDALEAFELDWECRRAAWQGRPPGPEQVDAMLAQAKAFAAQVNTILQEETKAWVEEFQSSMRQIDEAVKARTEAERARRSAAEPGTVNLTVTNGDQCAQGWVLSIDDGEGRPYRGLNAALAGLPPGTRIFKVSGLIGGVERHAQRAVKVAAGDLLDEQITLS